MERFFRTVREQFLVEIADTTAEEMTAAGLDHASALAELNRLFTAWVETRYHRTIHSETAQTPLDRWNAGWDRVGRAPAIPAPDDLTEAFRWSAYRTVTKTATVSLHANTYQVDPAKPETIEPAPPATGIDYLRLTAADHHEQTSRDERIGFDALYDRGDGEVPGQLSIDDIDTTGEEVSA